MKTPFFSLLLWATCWSACPLFGQSAWTEMPLPSANHNFGTDLETHRGKAHTSWHKNGQIRCARTLDNIHWTLVADLALVGTGWKTETISDGDVLYLLARKGTEAKAFWSADEGQNWSALGLPSQNGLSALVPSGDVLLAASRDSVWRSTDGGQNWQTALVPARPIFGFRAAGTGQNVLFSTPTHIFRSPDAGLNWLESPAPFDASADPVPGLEIFPTRHGLFVEWQADTSSLLFRSADFGQTWAPASVPSGLTTFSDVHDLQSAGGLLFGVFQNLLAVSADSGKTWSPRLLPPGAARLAASGDTLFATGNRGFFKSRDGARSWLTGNQGWSAFEIIPNWAPNFSGGDFPGVFADRLFLSSGSDFYSTPTGDGREWTLHSREGDSFTHLFSKDADTARFFGSGRLQTFDGGKNWDYLGAEVFHHPLAGQKFAAQNGFLFGQKDFSTLSRSADWGSSWEDLPAQGFDGFHAIAAADGKFCYLSHRIFCSTDNGQTFAETSAGLGVNPNLVGLWGIENQLFTTSNDTLHRLLGGQWQPAAAGLADASGALVKVQTIVGGAGRPTVLLGSSPTDTMPQIFLLNADGLSWTGNLGQGLPRSSDMRLAVSDAAVFVWARDPQNIFKSRLWKRSIPVSAARPPVLPKIACRVLPNPASAEAWLTLENGPARPGETFAALVFDANGRRVLSLGTVAAGGRARLDLKGLAPGIYSVCLLDGAGRLRGTARFVASGF